MIRLKPACGAAALLALLAGSPGAAHDWYTGRTDATGLPCCGGDDCAVVANARLRRTPTGIDVSILPGTHPRVRVSDWRECYYQGAYCTEFAGVHATDPVIFHFEGTPGVSPDGRVHACIDAADLPARRIRCLFLGGVS